MVASPTWLLLGKPLRAPLRDGTTVLASSLVAALPDTRQVAYLGDPGAPVRPGFDRVLPAAPIGYAPSLLDRARLLATLVDPRLRTLHVHLFFSPNPASQAVLTTVRRTVARGGTRRFVQTIPAGTGATRAVAGLRVLDAVVTTSEHTRASLVAAGLDERRVHCIRPGVTLPQHAAVPARSRRLLYAGDLDEAVAERAIALARLLRRPELSAWQLTLACRPKAEGDVVARARVRRELADAVADGRVEVRAQVDDMDALLRDTAVQLYLADHARAKVDLPLVLLEGLARGVGVLAVDAAPVCELLEVATAARCDIGGLVPPSPDACAAAIARRLLEPQAIPAWGQAARALARGAFAASDMAARYVALWQELERA